MPFFLAGTGALVEGTGERVTPLGALPPLARGGRQAARWRVSTAEAYARVDRTERPERPRGPIGLAGALRPHCSAAISSGESLLQQRFPAAIAAGSPQVATALDALRGAGAARPLAGRVPVRASSRWLRTRARRSASRAGWSCRRIRALDDRVRADAGMARVKHRCGRRARRRTGRRRRSARSPARRTKPSSKSRGITLVGRVLAALRASPSIGRIVVVAPPLARARIPALAAADELRPDGVRIGESLRSGLAGFSAGRARTRRGFRSAGAHRRIGRRFRRAAYASSTPTSSTAASSKRRAPRRYPKMPHTWARLRDGTFCGGGLVAIKPRALPLLERFIERLGAARKHPLRLASLFGWDMLARYAAGTAEHRAGRARARRAFSARRCARSFRRMRETAVNVDRAGDVALANELVRADERAARPARRRACRSRRRVRARRRHLSRTARRRAPRRAPVRRGRGACRRPRRDLQREPARLRRSRISRRCAWARSPFRSTCSTAPPISGHVLRDAPPRLVVGSAAVRAVRRSAGSRCDRRREPRSNVGARRRLPSSNSRDAGEPTTSRSSSTPAARPDAQRRADLRTATSPSIAAQVGGRGAGQAPTRC